MTTTRWSSPRCPRTGTTCQRTWPARRSSSSRTPTRPHRTSPSSSTTRQRAAPRPAPRPQGVGRQVPGQVRCRLRIGFRKIVHQRQLEMGIIPPGTELSPHDPDIPVWDTLSADEKRLFIRLMEVYAGFVTFTDYHFGRILDFLKEIGEAGQHADHRHLRQRSHAPRVGNRGIPQRDVLF